MRLRVGAATDIGQARERNEDAYLIDAPMFAVADGMGGHRAGDVASSLALETLKALVETRDWDRLADQVREANRVVFDRASNDRDLSGMGTTLTAVVAGADQVRLVHVGDSRAYRLRGGRLEMLSEDHTLVQRMVSEGRLTPQEAESHPQKSILTRALGVEEQVEVDERIIDVRPGDRIVLCSDGLTGMMRDASIEEILRGSPEPQEAAEKLVDAANRAGGLDNITVLVLDFSEDPADGAAGGAAPVAEAPAHEEDAGEDEAPVEPAAGEPRPTVEETEGEAPEEEVRAPRPSGAGDPEPWVAAPKPRRTRKRLIWIAAVLAVLGLAYLGLRFYLSNQWFVGASDDGNVAIFNGIPTEVLGYELHSVARETNLSADAAAQLGQWADLADGISANSEEHAEEIVLQIERDLAAEEEPPAGTGDAGAGA